MTETNHLNHKDIYGSNEIRKLFIEFFRSKKHHFLESAPLIPHNDPSLMFVNAGMVPFKNIFLGSEKPLNTRVVSCQKCVRAGGKHNDLDNVGYTTRHHTFFEMLGNFSFGDYFKEDAIKYAWEFLTSKQYMGFSPEKLYITVYHEDDEAFDIWHDVIQFDKDSMNNNSSYPHIIKIPTNDNFWSMGKTGPCGPCSEIFYDCGERADKEASFAIDEQGNDLFGTRFIEIWNLVFMQYNQLDDGSKIALPATAIDTGCGLERLVAVKNYDLGNSSNENICTNYDIDIFQALKQQIKHHIPQSISTNITQKIDYEICYNIISDHLRSISFLIADGVMPSNEGRGYVLRRIMRRAMRYVYNMNYKDPVIYKLVSSLVGKMAEQYPELKRAESLIAEITQQEEQRFGKTLDNGMKLLQDELDKLKNSRQNEVEISAMLSGEISFKLYDTYGFPLDLTEKIATDYGFSVDKKSFAEYMQQQKIRARAAWKGSGEQVDDVLWYDLFEQQGATEFLGYSHNSSTGKIIGLISNNELVEFIEHNANDEMEIGILLNQTPFYAESGGQIGDIGQITHDNYVLNIHNTQKKIGKLHVHLAKINQPIKISVGDIITAHINSDIRNKVRANHSVTHLLHAVLRKQLGSHITQKGSLVTPNKLRFDFSHPKALSVNQIQNIELIVNQLIIQNSPVNTQILPIKQAIDQGAMALFGEKYDDLVRVVDMGILDANNAQQDNYNETNNAESEIDNIPNEDQYSIELCGGTHVKNTGDIGSFKIISESAIASGVRRIEAITGIETVKYISNLENNISNIAALLKIGDNNIYERIEQVIAERKSFEKEIAKLKLQINLQNVQYEPELLNNNLPFLSQIFNDVSSKDLRTISDKIKTKNN
ncbi:MAG: alanine--tRNA ligase, partial [Pseudomonadota bacterium]